MDDDTSTTQSSNAGKRPLDTFTRNYLIGLGLIALIALGSWLAGGDSRVDALNELLANDTELAPYPYPFRVLSLTDGIAEMSSPRSAQMPAMQFLRAAFPELSNLSVQDEAMMAAQDQLAYHQSRAAELVKGHSDVRAIRWVLDEGWFRRRGILIP